MTQLDVGNCYAAAGEFLSDSRWLRPDLEVVLVHGLPTLQRPPFEKFGHAWVEYDVGEQRMARDLSNGHDLELPVDAYYRLGQIDPDECRRYCMADLRRWVTETGHWGPWETVDEAAL